jgi:hypothetical protein
MNLEKNLLYSFYLFDNLSNGGRNPPLKGGIAMVKNINGLGRDINVIASRPLDLSLDPAKNRIRVSTMLQDASELHLWMTVEQFQQSLPLLKLSCQKLGITWP